MNGKNGSKLKATKESQIMTQAKTQNQTSQIDWRWRRFNELTQEELVALFTLRQAVFIVEQNCPYLDIDGKDDKAIHLLGWQDDVLVATLRVFPSYADYDNHAAMGRICTSESARGFGLGKILVQEGIRYIQANYPSQPIQIGAQFYLKTFYEAFGFEQISEIYDEDGIDHILMIKEAKVS